MPPARGCPPDLADFLEGQMVAVGVGAKSVEPAKRLFLLQPGGRFLVHLGGFGTAERAAILHHLEHLFVRDEEGCIATDMIGSAMNNNIASAEGHRNAMNVRCGMVPVPSFQG